MKKFIYSMFLIWLSFPFFSFAINWNNDNFLNESFWAQNPTDSDIINALYWDGNNWTDKTAYTTNRSWFWCNTWAMTVEYINPWTSTIPLDIPTNKIYILNSWSYITTWYIYPKWCSAIIWNWNIFIYSDSSLSYMFVIWQSGTIIDNIHIDWFNNGNWWNHTINDDGLYFGWSSHRYNTVNNIIAYNNRRGIESVYWWRNTISNSQFFNNQIWIWLNMSHNI